MKCKDFEEMAEKRMVKKGEVAITEAFVAGAECVLNDLEEYCADAIEEGFRGIGVAPLLRSLKKMRKNVKKAVEDE